MNPYTEFTSSLEGCQRCDLYKNGKLVVDRGNPSSRVVLIGEAPGEEEAKTGQAFVGAAGKLLHQILGSLGVDSNSLLIINTVKHRPVTAEGKNRKPKPSEVSACLRYTYQQLYLVDPEYIVLMGATAFQYLAGKKIPVADFAGVFFDKSEFPNLKYCRRLKNIYGTYHPASAGYDPSLAQVHLKLWKRFFEVANG
jgi:uracil-DNA glycosylase